jgi:hypothetical protein
MRYFCGGPSPTEQAFIEHCVAALRQRDSQRPGGPFDQSGTVCPMIAA